MSVDVETTGVSPGNDVIIEIGAVLFENGAVVETFQKLLDPGCKLPPLIIALTGITDADLVGKPVFEDVRGELLEFIGDETVVGHNVTFDIDFLVAEGGIEFRFPSCVVLDTSELTRIFWPEFPRFSLAHLCKTFDVTLHSAHRALDDARASGELLVEMIKRLPQRVWGELTAEIAGVAGNSHHRAEKFFDLLRALTIDIPRPEPPTQDITAEVLRSISISELDAGGPFESNLPHFQPREQQINMANAVKAAFEQSKVLLLEAPTGIGKSIGYLVPSLEWALAGDESENRQVVVSAHTRSLQEQLLGKDIVDISRATGKSVPAAVLKGRENYLCKRRLRSALRDLDGRLSDSDRHKLLPLIRWSHTTERGDIGEIGGFHPEHEPLLWSLVCSDAAACSGAGCGANRGDFYRQAIDDAKRARILLVNHALLATDFARFLSNAEPERRLVIDEAHQFERAIVAAYTLTFSAQSVRHVLSRLTDERSSRGLLTKVAREARDDEVSNELVALDVLTKSLFRKIKNSFQKAAEGLHAPMSEETRKRLLPDSPEHEHLANALADIKANLQDLAGRLDAVLRELFSREEARRDVKERLLELRSIEAALTEQVVTSEKISSGHDSNYVYWYDVVGQRSAHGIALYAAPISVAAILDRSLWPLIRGALLTSATLTHEEQYSTFEKALGIRATEELSVDRITIDSPFALRKQMRCFCPAYLPNSKQTETHLDGVAGILEQILSDIPRNTLVLCTSHASADGLIRRLQPAARRHHRMLLQQRSGRDSYEMVQSFRGSSGGMLIGSSSLWEGIDLVGDALEILVVVKLPFDVPTDPWQEARCELASACGEDPFYNFSVPSCAIRLRQGLGRLIRHSTDRGIAILADTRLLNTQYGRVLQRSLPTPLESVPSLDELTEKIASFFT